MILLKLVKFLSHCQKQVSAYPEMILQEEQSQLFFSKQKVRVIQFATRLKTAVIKTVVAC